MWRLLTVALLCSLAEAHQTFMGYRRPHSSSPDATVKHERIKSKLLHWNRTIIAPELVGSHVRAHNHTAPPSTDILDGLLSIMQHVLDPFYDFLKAVTASAQEPPQTVRTGPPGRTSIPNLLY